MYKKSIIFVSLILIFGLSRWMPFKNDVFAGFNRTTGVINIPSAMNFLKEGDFEEGISSSFSSNTLSLNVRFNYAINDRSEIGVSIFNENTARLNFHWQAIKMQRILIALGIQNISFVGGADISFTFSPYVVATLYFSEADMCFHIGQGMGRFLNETNQTSAFSGVFWGLEKTIRALKLLFDFDGNYINVGAQYFITPAIILEGAGIRLNDTRQGFAACIGLNFIQQPSIKKSLAEMTEKIEQEVMKKVESALPSRVSAESTASYVSSPGITGVESRSTIDNLALEHAQTGTRYYYQAEYEKAIDSFKMAISLNPNFALFHSQLGSVYYKLKMYESAIAEWEKAYEMNPSDKQLKNFIEEFKRIRR